MPLAERNGILGDQPPFSPTPPAAPEPVSRYQQVLEATTDWVSRRGLLVPLSLFVLISFSTYLAYQSQVVDESAAPSIPSETPPDGVSRQPAAPEASSSTTSSVEGRSTISRSDDDNDNDNDDSSPGSLTTTTTERARRTTARQTTTTTDSPSSTATPTTASTTSTTASTTSSTAPPTSSEPPPTPSLTTTTAPPTTTTTQPTTTSAPPPPLPGPNELANGGFEQPRVDDTEFRIVAPNGWSSSSGSMEIWGNGHNSINALGGRQFAELNVRGATTISQRVTVTPGATYDWSFAHRGRNDNDTVQVLVGGEVVAATTSGPGSWNTVQGTTVIPDGQTTITFAIQALDAGGAGNLVDRARFIRIANP